MANHYSFKMKCEKCQHESSGCIEVPMHLEAFATRVKAWGVCPSCGVRKAQIVAIYTIKK